MTEKMEETTDNEVQEVEKEKLYAQLEKWQAALRMNKHLQSNYRDEVIKYRTLRDQLQDQIKSIRDEALKEKDLRDNINLQVAKLKEDRSSASTQIADLKQKRNDAWDQVKQIRTSLKELISRQKDAKKQLKSIYPMLKRLEELDWTIMTQSMPFEKEQNMMNEIDQIVSEIAKEKGFINYDHVILDFDAAKKQIDELKEVAQQYHNLMIQTVEDNDKIHAKIQDLVKESEKHHQAMQELFAQIDPLKKEEEAAHQSMVENLKEVQLLETGKEEIYKEIRVIEKQFAHFKTLEMQQKVAEQEKILDKKAQEALAKLESGKKLSMDEFGLLLKKGLIKTKLE